MIVTTYISLKFNSKKSPKPVFSTLNQDFYTSHQSPLYIYHEQHF